MIKLRSHAALGATALVLALLTPQAHAVTAPRGPVASALEREFRYGPEQVRLLRAQGQTRIEIAGGLAEDRPGLPDLPSRSEVVEVPAGMRVAGVDVLELETVPLGADAAVPPALKIKPGIEPEERTAPDAAAYARAGFQPEIPVRVGYQGTQRERNLVVLQVWPVRLDAPGGRLERISRLRVRLRLEADGPRPLERLRVVPEWEGAAARAASTPPAGATPRAGEAQPFRPTQLPSVLGSPVAYVIITTDELAPIFQQLADWKTQSGEPAAVRTMSFIRQQYPFGSDDAERVRRFIRDAYQRWGAQYVLLGGDTEQIPTRFGRTIFYNGEDIASDLYYSCLDGNWNADGDSLYGEGYYSSVNPGDNADLLPEVWVGRAPAATPAEAQRFVNKTLQYIRTPVADYMDHILFFAEVLFPQDWIPFQPTSLDGAELIEFDILPLLDVNAPGMKYARLYENYTDARWRAGALQETRAAVIDSLNVGYNIAVHIGHGYRTVMSVGDDNLTSNDAYGLTNGNRLINLYAINCTSNAIDFPCIGESFLHAPNGGAVTNIGSTRFDFPTTGRAYQQEYFRLLFQDGVTAIGEAQGMQKLPFLAQANYDGVARWTQMTLLLLGDPSLRIYTDTPQTLTVNAPASIAMGDGQFSVHVAVAGVPREGALVTAYKAGDDHRSVVTDVNGDAIVPFVPDSTGNLTLTVTDFNCRPNQSTVAIVAGGAPALGDLAPALDDDNVGGTQGNGNALWDAGEVIDLRVPVRNNGGGSATGVIGMLSTTDPLVTVVADSVFYDGVAVGATSNPAVGFRVSVPYTCPDQREVPFTLTLTDDASHTWVQTLQIVVRAPELAHYIHSVSDAGGNSNGRPDAGETVSCFLTLRNLGTGIAQSLSGRLRNTDGLATITDSMVTWPDLSPGQEAAGDAVVYVPSSAAAKFELHVFELGGELLTQTMDLSYPPTPVSMEALGRATSIKLTWGHLTTPDLRGYNILRSSSALGPFSRVNSNPTDREAYYLDSGLAPLTRYYYEVAAVDSSGNESAPSAPNSASTNPPLHTIFPIPTNGNTPSPILIEHIYPEYAQDIVAGSEVLYVLHPDGSAPVDADGAGTTQGDFSTLGQYFAGGASAADLDGDGTKEIVAATFNSQELFVFDLAGNTKPGFPIALPDIIWSAVAIGDVDGDGHKEMVFASRGTKFYAFRDNGTELLDGDSNPLTTGVFKVLGAAENNGSPALADLDGDGKPDIIYASSDGALYAWHANGTNLPGFPVAVGAGTNASVAVGYLDGPGDAQLDIVVAPANNSLTVIRADGSVHPGFPIFMRTANGFMRTPSPALADMNNDGFLDIVCAGTNGGIYVVDHNGFPVPPWANIRYSTLTSSASESSPVVADINGDGLPDVVMGDENGSLSALSGGTGALMAGFPIQLEAEVKGTPAVCDCDGDTKTEIVVAGWDKNIHMWDYDFPFSPGVMPPWPQFQHDAQRTGYIGTPILVGVGDPVAAAPQVVELTAPAPNPTRAGTRFAFGVPADRAGQPFDLAVYDISGRRVQTLERGVSRGGRFAAAWDLRDERGTPVQNGIYFVRLTLGGTAQSHKLAVLR